MNSTGNDIVALGKTNKERSLDLRFYSKILSAPEKALYSAEKFPGLPLEHFVWLLWSIKESAYKFQKRLEPALLFTPTKMIIREINIPSSHLHSGAEEIQWENSSSDSDKEYFTAVLHWRNEIFYSRSLILDDLISTVVSSDRYFKNINWGYSSIDHSDNSSQSLAVRKLLLERLALVLPKGNDDLHVENDSQNCPFIVSSGAVLDIPVSLAHHDRFIAYSFLFEIQGSN